MPGLPIQRIGVRPARRQSSAARPARRLLALLPSCLLALPFTALAAGRGLPLQGHTEPLSFSTATGSWLSVDVAPDGETLVFDLLGDLYELPIGGGIARPITRGLAFDSQPRLSPDGQWIAFISDRDGTDNLWISRRDGSDPRRLSSATQDDLVSPSWSPDGQWVLVTRVGVERELVLFHVDGGSGVALSATAGTDTDTTAAWGMGAVIAPDNRYLYYAGPAESTRPVDNFPATQIFRFDRVTGHVEQITQGTGGGVRPLLSPDGQLLVYGTREDTQTGLRIRDLASGSDRWLTWPVQRDAQEGYLPPSRDLLPGHDFTPDGRAVVFNHDGRLWRVDVATGERREIPFRTDVELAIGPDLTAPYRLGDEAVTATLIQSPALAPAADRVVASVLGRLYSVDLGDEASNPQALTAAELSAFRPAWSPDGRWLVFTTWSDRDGGHLWRLPATGRGDARRLTRAPAFFTDMIVSSDGETVYALRGNAFQRQQTYSEFGGLRIPLELVSLPAAGGDVSVIGSVGTARGLHLGPDPGRLYLSDESGLFSITTAGLDRRAELKVTAPRGNRRDEEPPAAESLVLSPDGRHVLAFAQKQLWLLPALQSGGQAPTVDLRDPSIPVARLTDIGADHFGWSADGHTIWWSIGRTFYRRPLGSVSLASPIDAESDCDCDASVDEPGGQTASAPDGPRDEHPAVTARELRVTFPRDRAPGSLLLHNVQVIAMAGDDTAAMARVAKDQDVLVTDGRIAALGPAGSLSVPAQTDVLDLEGRYLLPGFIDTHAHWEFRTDDVLEAHTWSLAANLAYGVTTGLDVQTFTEDYFAYRDLVATGRTVGQRALMTGPGIFGDTDFESYEAAHAYLRRYRDHYGTRNIKAYLSGNRRQRQWVVLAARDLGLMPTTEGGGDQKLDLTHAIDGMHGNEHTLPESPLGDDIVTLYARTRTAYTPTLIVQYNAESMREYFFTRSDIHDDPKLRRFTPANRLDALTERRPGWQRDDEFRFREGARDAAKIQRAGGLVGVGGHAELQGLGYHWELWAYVMGGMEPVEALRAATIDGARIIGVAQDLGSIEVGKLADLVVLDANPLDDIRHSTAIHRVIQNGRVYDANTLNELWPRARPFPPFWWWDAGPEGNVRPANSDDASP